MVANTGWTWDEALDQLTTPRFLALAAEWRRNPPTHWLVASTLGYRPPGAAAPSRHATIAELKAAFPDGKLG